MDELRLVLEYTLFYLSGILAGYFILWRRFII